MAQSASASATRAVRQRSSNDPLRGNCWINTICYRESVVPHREPPVIMRDNFALVRCFLVPAVRSLFFLALALFGASATYISYVLMRRRISAYRSPLRNVPGPEKEHWIRGNFVDVFEGDSTRLQEEWVRTYGHVLKFHASFGVCFAFFLSMKLVKSYVVRSHRNSLPSTLLLCPMFYSTTISFRNRKSYVSTLVPSLEEVCMIHYFRVRLDVL